MNSNQDPTVDFSKENIQPPPTTPVEDNVNPLFQAVEEPAKEFKRDSIKKPTFSDKNLRNKCYMVMKKLA